MFLKTICLQIESSKKAKPNIQVRPFSKCYVHCACYKRLSTSLSACLLIYYAVIPVRLSLGLCRSVHLSLYPFISASVSILSSINEPIYPQNHDYFLTHCLSYAFRPSVKKRTNPSIFFLYRSSKIRSDSISLMISLH